MWQLGMRVILGILLIIHGFAHWQITNGWGAWPSASSWLLGGFEPVALNSLGTVLWVTTLLAFVVTGIVLFAGGDWWRPMTVVSSVLSLLVIGLFWQPNMVIGAAVDVGMLVALLWIHWPSLEYLGI
jgi:hypothetical protein